VIVDRLLDWGLAVPAWLISLLPQWQYDCSAIGSLPVSWIGAAVDWSGLRALLLFLVSFEVGVWSVQFMVWLLRKLPFVGVR
jgi:hypothetical protein